MAQFLVKKADRPNTRDWKRGDPVMVFDDSHIFGTREDKREWWGAYGTTAGYPDDFVIIRIIDMDIAEARTYCAFDYRPAVEGDPEFNAPDENDRQVLRARRLWKIDLNSFPLNLLTILDRDGYIEVLRGLIRDQFFNKQTGAKIPMA